MMEQLLSLAIKHSYYSDNRCRDMIVRPSEATAALLRKWGIIYRVVNGNLVLLCETLEDQPGIPALFPSGAFKMVFLVSSSNPYFLNFTDLPLAVKGKVLYFSNHYDNVQDNALLLHKESAAGGTNQVMLRPLSFAVRLEDAQKENEIVVKDNAGDVVLHEVAAAGIGEYYVSLRGEGLYTIEIGKGEPSRFYALGDARGPVLGVIELFVDNKVPAAHRMVSDNNTVAMQQYALQFSNRVTTWAYYIKGNAASENMWIGSTRTGIEFLDPKQVTLLNGDKVTAFYSGEPLPLEERPKAFFQLRKGNRDGSVLVDALPAAGISMIHPSKEGNIYSEIHINL